MQKAGLEADVGRLERRLREEERPRHAFVHHHHACPASAEPGQGIGEDDEALASVGLRPDQPARAPFERSQPPGRRLPRDEVDQEAVFDRRQDEGRHGLVRVDAVLPREHESLPRQELHARPANREAEIDRRAVAIDEPELRGAQRQRIDAVAEQGERRDALRPEPLDVAPAQAGAPREIVGHAHSATVMRCAARVSPVYRWRARSCRNVALSSMRSTSSHCDPCALCTVRA